MKRLLSMLVAVMFALFLTGLSFAQEQTAPAAEKPKVEEKAPAKEKAEKKKTKKQKKEKKSEAKQEEQKAEKK
jgi:Ni/Co efflux regulator RcnB